MIALNSSQIWAGLVFGMVAIGFSWLARSDRVVNRIVDGFVRMGRATDLDRDIQAARLRGVAWFGMAMGLLVFGVSLADLLG